MSIFWLRKAIATVGVAVLLGLVVLTALIPGGTHSINRIVVLTFGCVAILVAGDVAFRLLVRLRSGRGYVKNSPLSTRNLYIIPHPYFRWIYRPKNEISNPIPINYPLAKGVYTSSSWITSSLGFVDGPEGNRDISPNKQPEEFRIVCIGASTTGNYLQTPDGVFSYPSELEKNLQADGFSNATVVNSGVGGYNSADILVRFALQTIDLQPDCIIIYHAYNDIRSYLTPGLTSDFAHANQSLAGTYWKFQVAEAIPTFGLAALDYFRAKFLAGNIRNSLLSVTARGTVDLTLDPTSGLEVYRRNIQSIIDLAKSRDIEVVLGTYCHFLYAEIKHDSLHLRYHEIVGRENQIMLELAEANELLLVDNASDLPPDEEFFVDSIHFNPSGMAWLAGNFAGAIKSILTDRPNSDLDGTAEK
jgi:lysophospholipase L1-like esterase